MSAHKGFFISFEGGEGAGKTTQINQLAQYLTEKKHKVITTREPGGTSEGEKIRQLLVQRDGGNWSPIAECLLIFAARIMHVEKVILPALQEGKIVISDRFTDSTIAYQGYGHGLSRDKIDELRHVITDTLEPGLTFILDIAPEDGLMRSGRRLAAEALKIEQTEDKYENLDIEFHQKLRQGYLDIAKENPGRCYIIDASQSIEDIQKQVQDKIDEVLKEKLAN